MQLIKLSEYAKLMSITYGTAHSWYEQGILQHETILTPTNRIMVKIPDQPTAPDIVNKVAETLEIAARKNGG